MFMAGAPEVGRDVVFLAANDWRLDVALLGCAGTLKLTG